MKMKHIIYFKSGNTFEVEFKTKKDSDMALTRATHNNLSPTIDHIEVFRISQPETRKIIKM